MFLQLNILAFVAGTWLLQQQANLPEADKVWWLLPTVLFIGLLGYAQSMISIAIKRILIWILIGMVGFF